MADYTRGTGSGGVMLIRDLGNEVQFFIQAGSTSTFANGKGWSWRLSAGQSGGGTFNYPRGRPMLYLGSINVTSTTDVYLSIGATGTSGLGGPTDFGVHIDRYVAPPPPPPTYPPGAPVPVAVDTYGPRSLRFIFSGTTDGGKPILEWQIGYGKDGQMTNFVGSNGTTNIGGLQPATNYTFWARGRNENGWGPWSTPFTWPTLASIRVKSGGKWYDAVPYVKIGNKWWYAEPKVKRNGSWKKAI